MSSPTIPVPMECPAFRPATTLPGEAEDTNGACRSGSATDPAEFGTARQSLFLPRIRLCRSPSRREKKLVPFDAGGSVLPANTGRIRFGSMECRGRFFPLKRGFHATRSRTLPQRQTPVPRSAVFHAHRGDSSIRQRSCSRCRRKTGRHR